MSVTDVAVYRSSRSVLVRSDNADYLYLGGRFKSLFHELTVLGLIHPQIALLFISVRRREQLKAQRKHLVICVSLLSCIKSLDFLSCKNLRNNVFKRLLVKPAESVQNVVVYLVVLVNYQNDLVILFGELTCEQVILLLDKLVIVDHLTEDVRTLTAEHTAAHTRHTFHRCAHSERFAHTHILADS